MSTFAAVGKSISASAGLAGQEAATRACAALGGRPPHFCLVFGTSGYDQAELLRGVRAVVGTARLSGCTGEGLIAGAESDERDRAVGVLVVRSDALCFEPLLSAEFRRRSGRLPAGNWRGRRRRSASMTHSACSSSPTNSSAISPNCSRGSKPDSPARSPSSAARRVTP